MSDWLVVNADRFPHETIDNETVLFDSELGHIVLLSGFAAAVWIHFVNGAGKSPLLEAVEGHYGPDASAVTEMFVDELLEAQLLMPSSAARSTLVDTGLWPKEFLNPVIERFDDIAKIIAMDPIHDVDETGWPRPAKS